MQIADMMQFGNEASREVSDKGDFYYHPMMWGFGYGSGLFGILWLVTWILIIVVLIVFIRWLWKKGDKVK